MATPWWLGNRTVNVSGDNGSGNYEQQQYDSRTGRRIYQDAAGKYAYELPKEAQWGMQDDGNFGWSGGSAGQYADDSPLRTASFTPGQKSPYGNLGVEAGMVDGKRTYLVPAGAPELVASRIAGDIGMYGGAQKAQWISPSGAKGEVVTGPDGNKYIAVPQDAQFQAPKDTADHQTMLQGAWKDFGPIIMAAAGGGAFTGGESLAAAYGGGVTGAAAAGATMGGINALGSGGDVAGGILKGGALGGAGYGIGNAMSGTGFPASVQAGASNFLTNLLSGQSPTQAAVGGTIAGANRAFASPSYDAATDAALGGGMGGRESLSSNNLVPSGNAPLPTVPATTGGKMAEYYDDTGGMTNPSYADQPTAPAGYTSGSDLPSGDTSGGGGAIPAWLAKFFATTGVPGALISGAGSLIAANMTGDAARDAAARSGEASAAATALQAQQYADAKARSLPYYTAGVNALAKYADEDLTRPFAMSDYTADPSAPFRFKTGMDALNHSLAAKGMGISGPGMEGAIKFGQNFGSQEYQNAYNRYGQDQATRRNTLANIAGFGPPAAGAATAAGTNYATNAGNLGMGAANTFANADMAAAASQASAYGGIGNALGRAFSPDPYSAMLAQMMQKQYGVG